MFVKEEVAECGTAVGRVGEERVEVATPMEVPEFVFFPGWRLSLKDLLLASAGGLLNFLGTGFSFTRGAVGSKPEVSPEVLASGKVTWSKLGRDITSATRSVPSRQWVLAFTFLVTIQSRKICSTLSTPCPQRKHFSAMVA
jgi:hypothetical protein